MVPAMIDDDSEANLGGSEGMDDHSALVGCEECADEEFHDCCEVAYPSVATLYGDEKFNKQCARFGLDPWIRSGSACRA